jgi:uncharacterized damage-inducible protein DinB
MLNWNTMKKLALIATIAFCALPVLAQENKMTQMLSKHWKTSMDLTLAVAAAMPDAGYSFKPNADEMDYGTLMAHIAVAQASYVARAAGDKSPFAMPKTIDKAGATKLLTDSFNYCIGKIDAMKDDDLSKMVGPEGKQVAVAEAIWGGFTHTIHHRGQAEVYLRVKDIKPPAYKF